jgi:hypothetical protein
MELNTLRLKGPKLMDVLQAKKPELRGTGSRAGLGLFCAAFLFSLNTPKARGRAQNLDCNRAQTLCEVEDRNLIIGDRVGIINDDEELVATGEVLKVDGANRQIKIKKRHGNIKDSFKLTLLENRPEEGFKAPVYRVYQEPSKHSVGASLGLSTYSIGLGSPGMEATTYYQKRFWKGAQWIVRGNYLKIRGEANRYTDVSVEQLPIDISAYSLLGGGVYTFLENRPLSIRTELALGFTNVSATIDGDKELVQEELKNSAKVKNGTSPYVRWSLGAQWNYNRQWNFLGDISQCLINLAYGTTVGLGVSRILQ